MKKADQLLYQVYDDGSYQVIDVFDRGPQLSDPKHGPEPSIREIIKAWYMYRRIPELMATKWADEYIEALLK
jgi:hypothetical protein